MDPVIQKTAVEVGAQVVQQIIIPAVCTVVTGMIPWFVHRLMAIREQETGLKADAATEQKYTQAAVNGITAAESKFLNMLKTNPNAQVPVDPRLQWAINFANEELDRTGVESEADTKIEALVESQLGKLKKAGELPALPAWAKLLCGFALKAAENKLPSTPPPASELK